MISKAKNIMGVIMSLALLEELRYLTKLKDGITYIPIRGIGMEECNVYLPEDSIKELLNRILRIEGQVKGLQRMLKERRSCNEILIQISAVKSALNSVAIKLLKDHAEYCVKPGIERGDIKAFEDFLEALEKLIKGGC